MLNWLFPTWRRNRPPTCAQVTNLLDAVLDESLPPAQMTAAQSHLHDCPACQHNLRLAGSLARRLQLEAAQRRQTLSPAAAARTQRRLYQTMRRRMIMRNNRLTLQGALAFLVLALAVGLFVWYQQSWPAAEPSPAVERETAVTLTMAGSDTFRQAYETLAQQFQDSQPHIEVRYVSLSQAEAAASYRDRAGLADILILEGRPPASEAAGVFRDLTPLMAADARFAAGDFWPGALNGCQAGGVQIGLPLRANPSLILFDKAAFDAAGLPHPAPGWDWTEFQRAAQALTERQGDETIRYGFVDGRNPLNLLAPMLDNMITAADELDGHQLAAALEWYVALVEQGAIPAYSGEQSPAAWDALINARQAAIWVGNLTDLSRRRAVFGDDLGAAPFPAAAAPFPAAAGAAGANPATVHCALISGGSAQSQPAWEWLHFLSQQRLPEMVGLPAVPVRPLVAESGGYWAQMEAATAVAVRHALEHGWYRRAEMPELAAVGEALTVALRGEATLAESLPSTVEIQPTAPPPTPDSEPVAVATPRVTPTADPNVIVIDYDASPHDDRDAVIALAQAFNESQDRIRVNVTTHPLLPQGGTMIEYAAESDCFMNGIRATYLAEQHGEEFLDAYYSLSPLLDAEEAAFQDDFTQMPRWLEINTVNGELYALPVAIHPVVFRYNSDLLDELGVAPPTADWTVEEFWALVQEAGSGSAYGLVATEGLQPIELLTFVPGAAYYFDLDTRPVRPKFTDPAVVGALTFLGEMAEAGVLYPNTQWASRRTWEEDRQASSQAYSIFRFGRAAVWGHHIGSYAGDGVALAYAVAPYPQRTLPNYFTQEGTGSPRMLYISRRSPDPTACWEWFKFLTAQPELFLGLPVRQSIRESAAWREVVGEEMAVALEAMVFRPRARDSLPDDFGSGWEFWTYQTWWADALLSVFEGEEPSLALAESQRRAEAFYVCYAALEEPIAFSQAQECARQADPNFQK
jgi:ABC-type glycerol-3-phosphate transport system substrate-binding protein